MRKLWEHRLSRRRLLGGAAAVTAAPVLHELIPHQGLHGGSPSAAAAVAHHKASHHGSGHRGAVGRVDPRVTASTPTRSCATSTRARVRERVREWEIVAEDREIEVAPGCSYAAWTYNGRVPGPTLRAREGERLRVRFVNGSSHPHTMHFHGIHRDVMDGVPGLGAGNVEPGQSTVYEFDAAPFGLHLYHCHSTPLAEHIAKGLYGAFIIDPKDGRADGRRARDGHERLRHQLRPRRTRSTPSTRSAFAYMHEPIRVKRGELVRIYLVNALEFDPLNSFHIHANFFDYFPTGTRLEPSDFTDTVDPGPGRARDPRAALPLRREVHVPRPRVRVRASSAGWASSRWGLMEAATAAVRRARPGSLGLVPLVLLAVAIGLFVALDAPGLERIGVPSGGAGRRAHRAAARRDRAAPAQRRRRSGARRAGDRQRRLRRVQPRPTTEIGRLGASEVTIPYPWIEGETYEVTLLTSTGATIDHDDRRRGGDPGRRSRLLRPDGADRPLRRRDPDRDRDALAPWVRRIDRRWVRFVLAFTVGLLGFLASTRCSRAPSSPARAPRRWAARALVWLGAAGAYLALAGRGRAGCADAPDGERRAAGALGRARRVPGRARDRPAQPGRGPRDRLGLRGRVARARRRLVVGFALHNTTEGLAIVAPVARSGTPALRTLVLLGLLAGAPADPRRLDRRLGVQPERRRAHVRRRRRRDRPGDRPDRASARDGDGRAAQPAGVGRAAGRACS